MRSAVMSLAAAGGLYWAYREGHLKPVIDWARGIAGDDTSNLYESSAGGTSPAFGGDMITIEEALLEDNYGEVQPWARKNITWVAAMMWQESRGDTNAVSAAGARGLMQVMPGTMGDLYRWGWDDYAPEPANLHLPNVGIYFGTAYLEYLSRKSKNLEWITRAYNAGPGGERADGTWPPETVDYLARIKARYNEINKGVFV